MSTHLKIKIINLADEARTIRNEERRTLRKLQKSRATEELRSRATREHRSLWLHRTGIVRRASRHNMLAYGFLRGTPYTKIEPKTQSIPDFKAVMKHVRKFARPMWMPLSVESTWEPAWELWQAEAMKHLQAQGHEVEQ